MKYTIEAKILGYFLPENQLKIADCFIQKSYHQFSMSDDSPGLPVRDKTNETTLHAQGLLNMITYPQKPISVRSF